MSVCRPSSSTTLRDTPTSETPITDPATGTIISQIRWAVLHSDDLDDRAMGEGLPGLPLLGVLEAANASAGSGASDVVCNGTGLLSNQEKAVLQIEDAAAAMRLDLEAVVPGGAGNDISCEVITPSSTLLVSVVGNVITIRPASGGSTIAAIAAAINAEADALLLVQATVGVAGTLNEAVDEANLAGGVGPGVSLTLGGTACVLTEVLDTELTFDIPTGIGANGQIAPLVYRNGPHTSQLSVPIVT
jgi:hypothetical protein